MLPLGILRMQSAECLVLKTLGVFKFFVHHHFHLQNEMNNYLVILFFKCQSSVVYGVW